MPEPASTDQGLAHQVWDSVCRHIDGMVIGSTMAALERHGTLALLARPEPTSFAALQRQASARPGYLNVAIRLLADQGFLTCTGEPGTDDLAMTPTPTGRVVMTDYPGAYPAAAAFLPLASRIDAILDAPEDGPLTAFADLMDRDWNLPPSGPARHQVLSHLNGHLLAPLMFALTRRGTLTPGTDLTLTRPAARILARQGWAVIAGDRARVTPAGEVAVALARQYRYPMIYLPLLRRVPELIFYSERADPPPSGNAETHLDRELDISFSGDVFAATCRAPFLDIALPLFDREPVNAQPALVFDIGCGDGGLLAALYQAVRDKTVRGRQLGKFPLVMAGADPSPVARRVAAARLSAAGVPHVIMDGDIADPDQLARDLATRGLDARDALHVCKSAIHDRAYHPPTQAAPPPQATPAPPASSCAFAQPDGTAIPASLLALDLAGFFRAWRPLTRRHGWIVIEAHAAASATIAGLIGRTVATGLDATHGYSCQYPVEPEVFAWAAQAAGFRSRQHAEPAAQALGHTLLTIDHFVDAGTQAQIPDAQTRYAEA
jgi:SAM-dependent methyltransferase